MKSSEISKVDRIITDTFMMPLDELYHRFMFWSLNELKALKWDRNLPDRWHFPGGRW